MRLLVTYSDGEEPTSLIVALDAPTRKAFERDRGFRFFGPADFKRMKQVFSDRERTDD